MKLSRILKSCLVMIGMLGLTAGCARLNLSQSSLMRDPANETQSAIASLAAATPSPIPSSPTPIPSPSATIPVPPTSTPTTNAPQVCAASDLLVNVRSDTTGNAMVFNVSLSNAGNRACLLTQPPKASLVTLQGVALDVNVTAGCSECVPKAPIPANQATRNVLIPTQTAAAQSSGSDQLDLGPNQTAVVVLRWTNWCDAFPAGGIAIQLDLASGGLLTLPTDAQHAGACTTPGQPSALAVSPFFINS